MARNGLSCADVPHSLTPTDVKADYMSDDSGDSQSPASTSLLISSTLVHL